MHVLRITLSQSKVGLNREKLREQLEQTLRSFRLIQPSVRRGFALLVALIILNIVVGVGVLALGRTYPILLGLALLSWGLGLRHAMDADHIAAIDNATRQLLYRGKPSVGIGFYFSLGHSTIVFLLTATIAYFATFSTAHMESWRSVGAIVGSMVSSIFLIIIGTANLFVLKKLFGAWKDLREGRENTYHGHMHLGGPIEKLFRPLLRMVDRSAKMYFIGFLFGLGFDTATEIGLLSLSAIATVSLPPWTILILPLAFMSGMALLDTLNGLLMLGIYTSGSINEKHRLLYNINITGLSALAALSIGFIVGVRFLGEHFGLTQGIFGLASRLNIDTFGYMLVTLFLISWSMMFLGRKTATE